MRLAWTLLAFAVIGACVEKTTVPAPSVDDLEEGQRIDACKPACTTLRELGCPEGFPAVNGAPCDRTCAKASTLRTLPLECWTRARTVVEARSCGSLRCVH